MGYRCPLISTVTSRPSDIIFRGASETDRVELLQHVLDPTADLFALRLERRQFGAGAFAFGYSGAGPVELGAQAPVLVLRAGEVYPGLLEDPDELLEFLFEPVD